MSHGAMIAIVFIFLVLWFFPGFWALAIEKKMYDILFVRKDKKTKEAGMARNVFLICPVRGVSEEEKSKIAEYVAKLEEVGHKVHWPYRDTDQDDPTGGIRICHDNHKAIKKSDEVHIWYNRDSKGSIFDLGIVYALKKIVVLANPEDVKPTQEKSFENLILKLDESGRATLRFFGLL